MKTKGIISVRDYEGMMGRFFHPLKRPLNSLITWFRFNKQLWRVLVGGKKGATQLPPGWSTNPPPYVQTLQKINALLRAYITNWFPPRRPARRRGGCRLTSDDDQLEAEYFVCTWGEIWNLET